MPTSTSTHVSSLIALAVSVIALFHPGFTISPDLQSKLVILATSGALLLQALNLRVKAFALRLLHEFQMQQQRLLTETNKVINEVDPTVVPASVTADLAAPVSVTVSQVPSQVAHEGSNNVPNQA